jgi:hypothetical protein
VIRGFLGILGWPSRPNAPRVSSDPFAIRSLCALYLFAISAALWRAAMQLDAESRTKNFENAEPAAFDESSERPMTGGRFGALGRFVFPRTFGIFPLRIAPPLRGRTQYNTLP